MKTRSILLAISFLTATTLHAPAQGLFAKAANQAKEGLAAYEAIWDSFYGKFDELLVAEAVKDGGQLEFDADKGMTHFPIRLKINEEAYAKWKTDADALLGAAGIQKGDEYPKTKKIGGTSYVFPDGVISEINKACIAGELVIPRIGVIVELVDENGKTLQHAALPLGVFKLVNSRYDTPLPLHGLNRAKDYQHPDQSDEAMCSVSFAGLTKQSLLTVADIRCRVLVDPEFAKECRRLAIAKIESDNAVFAQHGIETKTIMLPGDVPFAVNKTPRGLWFSRYEITQDQWEAVMGNNPSVHKPKYYDSSKTKSVEDMLEQSKDTPSAKVDSPDMPIDMITYSDSLAFVRKLNALASVQDSGLVFSIPKGRYYHPSYRHEPDSHWNKGTPDWDYACLGGKAYGAKEMEEQGVKYGYDLEGSPMDMEEVAWIKVVENYKIKHAPFGDGYLDFVHPVGMKRPNAFGLYDMIGNASEIVQRVDDAGGDGIVKGPTSGNVGEVFDYTLSESYYTESDNGYGGRGLRLSATTSQQQGGQDNSKNEDHRPIGSVTSPDTGSISEAIETTVKDKVDGIKNLTKKLW